MGYQGNTLIYLTGLQAGSPRSVAHLVKGLMLLWNMAGKQKGKQVCVEEAARRVGLE
jgi:hypothetical protein